MLETCPGNPFHPHFLSVIHLLSNYYVLETALSIGDSMVSYTRTDLFLTEAFDWFLTKYSHSKVDTTHFPTLGTLTY